MQWADCEKALRDLTLVTSPGREDSPNEAFKSTREATSSLGNALGNKLA